MFLTGVNMCVVARYDCHMFKVSNIFLVHQWNAVQHFGILLSISCQGVVEEEFLLTAMCANREECIV
jgi:hypothetical protein